MGKKILLAIAVLSIFLLIVWNLQEEDPVDENEEVIGTGEEEAEGASEEEELGNEEEQEVEAELENPEIEDAEEADKEAEEDTEEDSEDTDKEITPGQLEMFYGTWEKEHEEDAVDVMILQINGAEAEIAKDQEEDFEYIRFGYKSSEFFPMEKIIRIEKLESREAYYITTVYVEEAEGQNTGMYTELSDEETYYTIELRDENTLLLTHVNDDNVTEMKFNR